MYYQWDLDGDGSADAEGFDLQDVPRTYTNIGLYSVSLSVTNAAGESALMRKDDYIHVAPAVLYVSRDGGHTAPYADWPNAATNIADALTEAPSGATILVSNGIHRIAAPLLIGKAITLRGDDGLPVIVDAAGAHRCIEIAHADAVVERLTITGGRADNGGGVLISDGLLRNCIVSNNTTTATLSADGGGVFLTGGTVRDCVIVDNVATDDGGGVQCNFGGTVEGCLVINNRCGDKAGGIFCWPPGRAVNCVVVGNQGDYGGGVSCRDGGVFSHCTVVSNTAAVEGGGIYWNNSGTSVNCIYTPNEAPTGTNTYGEYGDAHTFSHVCAVPAPAGDGNIGALPQFVDPAAMDFRLAAGSPGIDGGTNLVTVTDDIEGLPRPLDGDDSGSALSDMGAYEFLNPDADSDGDGMPDGWEQGQGFNLVVPDGDADADEDHFRNFAEYVAGTGPHNGGEYLRILDIERGQTPADAVLRWPMVSGRDYSVMLSTNGGMSWEGVYDAAGVDGEGSYTSTAPPAGAALLTIDVEMDGP